MKYAIDDDLDRQAGNITQGDVAIGKSVAKLTGAFQNQGEKQVLNLKLSAPNMSVDELEAMLPALGVVLPSGSKLNGGTLSVDLAINGPLDNLVIAGPVRLANTKLVGFRYGFETGRFISLQWKGTLKSRHNHSECQLECACRSWRDKGRRHQCDHTVPRRVDRSRYD